MRLEILRHRLEIGIGQVTETVADDFGHRPQRRRPATVHAGLEIGRDFVGRPRAQPRGDVGRQVEREPAVDHRAVEVLALLDAAQQVARRMAIAAVPETFDQVGAAIPRSRPGRIRPVRALAEIELAPRRHRPALVERKVQVIDRHVVADRLHRAQVRVDRVDVVARDPGIEVVRHGRIHVLAVLVHAIVQRAIEIGARPPADARLRVGRDVRRQHVAERRIEAQPAGERCAALRGMTGDAVARARQIFAALHGVCCAMAGPAHGQGVNQRCDDCAPAQVCSCRRRSGTIDLL